MHTKGNTMQRGRNKVSEKDNETKDTQPVSHCTVYEAS